MMVWGLSEMVEVPAEDIGLDREGPEPVIVTDDHDVVGVPGSNVLPDRERVRRARKTGWVTTRKPNRFLISPSGGDGKPSREEGADTGKRGLPGLRSCKGKSRAGSLDLDEIARALEGQGAQDQAARHGESATFAGECPRARDPVMTSR
jgi:hypothetical protein